MGRIGIRVLVVADDTIMRIRMVAALWEEGFDVLNAANGREALRLMVDPDCVDLLVTDVGRPWPDGLVVARHARLRRPTIPILFIIEAGEEKRLSDDPGPHYSLPRPFRPDALKAAIRAMMHVVGRKE